MTPLHRSDDATGRLEDGRLVPGGCLEAELLAESHTGADWHFEMRVPHELVHFSGHFPGLPILPGVVQIDWVMRLAARHFPFARDVVAFEQLKFVAPVLPGAVLQLAVTHDAARCRVHFVYTSAGEPCASGRIHYREAACA
jgi:3-hydroxymyristoyl/3-hydroxydecanoyl-(acyl carrier protein) dehydratase